MNIKKCCSFSVVLISAFTVVPLSISGAGTILPDISDKVVNTSVGRLKPDNSSNNQVYSEYFAVGKNTAFDIEAAPDEIQIINPAGKNIPSPLPTEDIINALPYTNNNEENNGSIERMNFGIYDGEQYYNLENGGQIRNCSDYSFDEIISHISDEKCFDIEFNSEEPQVLIYHTHTTETYELEDKDYYSSSFYAKTTDADKNMTAVGDEICNQLTDNGISVIHDTLVHDYPDYDTAYDSSRLTVQQILKQYPSIKIALDIHRDGIETSEGIRLAPVTEINGRNAAQIMIISGCDDGTMGMPDFWDNLNFACGFQSEAESLFPGLTRPILFDYRHYNQDLTTGSLLIEVGSHGNSLDEALYSGELIGKALAEYLK